jgi:hypothetical protein
MTDLPIDEEKTTIKGKEENTEIVPDMAAIDILKDPVSMDAETTTTTGTRIEIAITLRLIVPARTLIKTEMSDPDDQRDTPIQMPNQNLNHNLIQQTI